MNIMKTHKNTQEVQTLQQLKEQLTLIELIVGDYQEFCQRGEQGNLTHGDFPLYQEILQIKHTIHVLRTRKEAENG